MQHKASNQRLEFLGDAILDFTVVVCNVYVCMRDEMMIYIMYVCMYVCMYVYMYAYIYTVSIVFKAWKGVCEEWVCKNICM